MLLYPLYESTPFKCHAAASLAPTATAVNTDIVVLGGSNARDKLGSMGVELHFAVDQSGGATDSDVIVDLYRSYDGVIVDSEKAVTFTIDSSVTGITATHHYTSIHYALENLVGLGYAFRASLTRAAGTRTFAVVVTARRWKLNLRG